MEDKKVEPPAVVVQNIDGVPAINVPVDDKKELEKDSISDSHAPIAPAVHSVSKEAEEQQLSTSVEKLLQEKPKMVDVPVSLDGAIEKTDEPSKVLPIKESEPIEAKDTEDSAVSKEVDKAESIIPEVEVKLEDQSEVGEQVEEPKTEAEIEQPKEPLEVLPVKSEAVVKDSEDSQLVSKEDDKPESDEQSKVIKVEPKGKPVEVIVETQEPVEALPIKELEAVQVKDIDDSQELFKEADKVGTIVPEPREVKLESEVTEHMEKTKEQSVKQEEQSEFTEQIEKTESVVPESEVKLEEQSEVTKLDEKTEEHEVEVKPEGQSIIRELVEQSGVSEQAEKTESVIPETEVKPEEQSEVTKLDEKTEEHEVEVKSEEQFEVTKLDEKTEEYEDQSETSEHVKIKSTDEKPEQVAAITQLAQVEIKEDGEKSSLPEIIQKAGPEAEGTDLVEVSLKEIVAEAEKGGEEKEAGKIKAEGEKIASGALKEELAQPIKVEEVSNAASNAKITEKSFEGEKIVESVEPALENKKEEVPAKDETQKDGNIGGKLDEATTIVSESVKETQDSMSEVKEEEEETAKTNEESSEQEKVDEIAKSDTQNLESSVKDAEDAKESQDLPIEVPAKPTQKHSNNILTKVKQSLVKAKKAIIGKSPAPKTVSSDSKGDVKVNN
ncbi:transcriptional regulator ATRX [Salix suchowensis]|nr:transcriptional regulator ATRX [Salix suchowensis]